MSDPGLLEDYIQLYFTTFKNIDALIGEPMAAQGISFEQFIILRDLDLGHELAVSEIARRRKVTRAAISRQIRTLLAQGLITQKKDPHDQRILLLQLTAKGQEITTDLNEKISQRFAGWVEAIGADDARELYRIMDKVGRLIMN